MGDKSTASGNISLIDSEIGSFMSNDYVFAILAILAYGYGQLAKPALPNFMIRLFENDIFRVLFLSLLLFVRFETRPTVALIIALVFVYMLQFIYHKETKEAFDNMMRAQQMKKQKRQNKQTA